MLKTNKYYKMLILSGVLWGLAPFIYKMSFLFVGVLGFIAIRYAIGAILAFAAEHKNFVPIGKKIVVLVLIFAMLESIVPGYIYAVGIGKTSALHASMIALALPFFVYLFSVIFLKDKIHRKVIIGSILASAGLIIILALGGKGSGHASLLGDSLILFSQMLFALGIILAKKILGGKKVLPPGQLVFMEYFFGTIISIAVIFVLRPTINVDIGELSAVFWLIIAGTVGGSLPLIFYYRSIKFLPAERLGDINYIAPITGFVVAILFLGESVTLSFIVGAMLLFVGLLISNNKLHPVVVGRKFIDIEKEAERDIAHAIISPKVVYERISNR